MFETDTSVHDLEAPPPESVDDSFEHSELLPEARVAIERGTPIRLRREVKNVDLAVGGQLSYEIVQRHGPDGLPDDTIVLDLHGSAGQSMGAWLAHGVTIDLDGAVNDYAGKGLSGGILSCRPPQGSTFVAADNVIAGNVLLYGATDGKAFFNGQAGERFAIRNSGADAVVEGIGDHGCEYMTGGRVVVLGDTGENFGAGMSGGYAWVHDPEGKLAGAHEPRARRPRAGDARERRPAARADRRARRADRVEPRRRPARALGRGPHRVHPRDLARLQEGARRARADRPRGEGIADEAAARMDEAAA